MNNIPILTLLFTFQKWTCEWPHKPTKSDNQRNNMLRVLKRIAIFVFLNLFGRSKRKALVDRLTSKSRKQKYVYNVENVPAVLDDVTELPDKWRETLSFAGFDNDGLCARLEVERTRNEFLKRASLNLDIPSYGCFRYEEKRPNGNQFLTDEDDLCDGLKLKLHCQQAMARWRIYLSGTVRHISDTGQPLHIVVSLYWTCLFDPYDHFATSSCWIRAKHLSYLSWAAILSNAWDQDRLCYEQLGELRGRILIENRDQLDVRLLCVRERIFSHSDSDKFEKVHSEHVVIDETGLAISNSFIKLPNGRIENYAYIAFPFGDSVPVVSSIHGIEHKELIRSLVSNTHSYSASQTYDVVTKFTRSCFSGKSENTLFVRCSVNEKQEKLAFGLRQRFDTKMDDEDIQAEISAEAKSSVTTNHLKVVSLEDKSCMQRQLVGGKASNLSLLKQSDALNVPHGVCVTLNAFRDHVAMNSELNESIDSITGCLSNFEVTKLQETCNHTAECFQRVPISNDLLTGIRNKLNYIYGENGWNARKFAVRSSGECEDGVQLSTAGQMDTFLAVQGFDDIIDAIKKCWASAIAYRVVEYRRQNGQSLIEGMGVIIQEMVDAETAGVLFTSDPMTGNKSYMVINASFGLGEAVVSGQVNPDTIRVRRGRDNEILIEKHEVGEKLTKIIVDDEAGIRSEQVTDVDKSRPCLSEEEIKLICEKGSEMENILGSSQDIEWAMSKGELFVLQARPITVLDTETDKEIIHEFDRPAVNRNLLFTTANIQEVLPGAVSPLTGDIVLSASNAANRRSNKVRLSIQCPIHPSRHISTHAGVPLFCWTGLTTTLTMLVGDDAKSDMEMNFMGEVAEEHKLQTIKDYYGRPYPSPLRRFLTFLKVLLITNKQEGNFFETIKKKADTFSVGENAATSKDLYRSIDENIPFFNDTFYGLICKSMLSGTWALIIMTMLKGDTTEVMADMALILSDCKDVCSADVPVALNSLAKMIAKSELKEKFLETPDQHCDELIKNSNNTNVKAKYVKFLASHGHRCIREAEFYVKSWRQDPSPLMRTLKMIIKKGGSHEKANCKTVEEVVDGLKTPLSYIKKTLLKKYLVEKARDGVGQREEGKSLYIKVSDIFKQAYWRLAAMMVCEGRLPDERLLFFLTHYEIGKLIDSRPVRLIRLAKHRLRLWPEMNKIKYPKINIGRPKPIEECQAKSLGPVFTLKGMPVCLGKVDGKARVVKYVENADEIREGEILICSSTDIGWSPYFCLIRGLVTELGGLMSHGAVIARECGIPCVVNVSNATDLIKTGDHVLLDGGAGTVCKLD